LDFAKITLNDYWAFQHTNSDFENMKKLFIIELWGFLLKEKPLEMFSMRK
jgi:hypothetical protein